MTIIAALMASFYREQGPRGWWVVAITTPMAILTGWLWGLLLGSTGSRIFWAVVAALMIQVLTSNVLLRNDLDYYVWPVIAAVCGGLLGGPFPHVVIRMLFGAVGAAVCFSAYVFVLLRTWHPDLTVELMVAVKSGALLAVLIEFCRWLESRFKIPQSFVALGLMVLAIGGALIAPWVIPGW